jgi:hypothetical protein
MKYSDFCNQFNFAPSIKRPGIDDYLVYFLLDGDIIVYIGKSSEVALYSRIKAHQQDKQFDGFFSINRIPSEGEALELESGFISIIRPKYNKADNKVNIVAIQAVIEYIAHINRPTSRVDGDESFDIIKAAFKNPVKVPGYYEAIGFSPEDFSTAFDYLERLKKTARNCSVAANKPGGKEVTRKANARRLAFVQAELGRMSVGIVPGDAGPGSIKFTWLNAAERAEWVAKIQTRSCNR